MSKEAIKLALDELLAEYYMENSSFAKRVNDIFKEVPAQPQQEPVAWVLLRQDEDGFEPIQFYGGKQKPEGDFKDRFTLRPVCFADATPPAQRKPLTAREIELIDGMIEVQLDHAARCDNIPNRVMAEKQKGWDMERVELLRKFKENT